jgi:hypothetical protein
MEPEGIALDCSSRKRLAQRWRWRRDRAGSGPAARGKRCNGPVGGAPQPRGAATTARRTVSSWLDGPGAWGACETGLLDIRVRTGTRGPKSGARVRNDAWKRRFALRPGKPFAEGSFLFAHSAATQRLRRHSGTTPAATSKRCITRKARVGASRRTATRYPDLPRLLQCDAKLCRINHLQRGRGAANYTGQFGCRRPVPPQAVDADGTWHQRKRRGVAPGRDASAIRRVRDP